MATLWEKAQAAGKAAIDAWRGNVPEASKPSGQIGFSDGLAPAQIERLRRYELCGTTTAGSTASRSRIRAGSRATT